MERVEVPRRRVLQAGAALAAASGLVGCTDDEAGAPGGAGQAEVAAVALPVTPAGRVPAGVERTWLAPHLWANRLQHWRLAGGRVECVRPAPARTVGVLSRTIAEGAGEGRVVVRTGTLVGGKGWSGFLVGAGGGALDPRAAALVQNAGGTGGGVLCLYEADGHVRFRDHTDEAQQAVFAALPLAAQEGPRPARTTSEDVRLTLDIVAAADGRSVLTLTAQDARTGALLARGRSRPLDAGLVDGGLSLVSGSPARTARHWFADLATSTTGKVVPQDLAAGPVLGTMFSVAGGVLKLSAQLMPIGGTDPRQVELEVRDSPSAAWRVVARATAGDGWTALFRVPAWDSRTGKDYRVVWARGTAQEAAYRGRVPAEPTGTGPLVVATVNCTIHAYRGLDGTSDDDPEFPGASPLGLYTERNLYFPYARLTAGIAAHRPHVLVAMGDQYYETSTGAADRDQLGLDVLYKYALWLWSFRDLTRDRPTIVLTDDHDVFHRNLWGWAGAPAPDGQEDLGGYAVPPRWVDVVQHMQCGHDPDPYDPTPVQQGIDVYYTAFSYGGVSFAALEDRKFKTTNRTGRDAAGVPLPAPRDLLGARQETFLARWASMHPGQPKVCLTQTLLGTLQTDAQGRPARDSDSNGAPTDARDRAVRLLAAARAFVLSGDQHLASLVRHSSRGGTERVPQFTGPAGGTHWQRWFEPPALVDPSGATAEGEWTDAYGNPMEVLAVANPRIRFADYRATKPTGGHHLGDRALKREGYGIARIDRAGRRHVVECWPWDAVPGAAGAEQFPGWPRTVEP